LTDDGPGPIVLVVASLNRGLLNQLGRAASVDRRTTMVLQPLGENAIRSLVEEIGGSPADDGIVEAASGSPQVAIEQAAAMWLGHREDQPEEARLDHQLHSLKALPRGILSALAMVETSLTSKLLAGVLDAPVGEIRQQCERLSALHLMSRGPYGSWQLALRQLSESALGLVSLRRRDQVRLRLAYRLGRDDHGESARSRPTRARLLARSGRREEALLIGREHVQALIAQGFIDIALATLEWLALLADRRAMGAPREAVELRLDQVELAISADRLEHARRVLTGIPALAKASRSESALLSALALEARIALRNNDAEQCRGLLSRLGAIDDLSPPRGLATACLALGEWYLTTDDRPRAEGLLRRAEDTLERFVPASGLLPEVRRLLESQTIDR
jgi:hypothetical protein